MTKTAAEGPGGKLVLVEFEDGIAWVSLNRPEKRNAMNPALNREMLDVLEALEVDERCGVVVLTGAGEAFSAGMDLKEFFRESDHLPAEEWEQISRVAQTWQIDRLRAFPKPTIAMVNGWCFGGAFNIVISCDLAIAAAEANFGLSEINWGIIPAGNVLKSVSSVMCERDGLYYTLTGDPFDGRRAAEMKLVNLAVPQAELRERTRELARKLLSKNRAALRAAKHAFRRVGAMSWADADDYLAAKLDQLRMRDPEQGRREGMRQFLDDKSYRPGLGNYRREEK